jgi:hypothetical protein
VVAEESLPLIEVSFMGFSAQDWQRKLYLEGLAGMRAVIPADAQLLEQVACKRMTPEAKAYVSGGAGIETTISANRSAFSVHRIVPRVLRDVSARSLSIRLFDHNLPTPVLLAPIGVLELVHREADLAVARAARTLDVPMIFSNQASVPMENCAKEMGAGIRWFQLYWSKSRELVSSFVSRAEACGCAAIVLTLDTTLLGWRPQDLNAGYLPFLEGKGIPSDARRTRHRRSAGAKGESCVCSGADQCGQSFSRQKLLQQGALRASVESCPEIHIHVFQSGHHVGRPAVPPRADKTQDHPQRHIASG